MILEAASDIAAAATTSRGELIAACALAKRSIKTFANAGVECLRAQRAAGKLLLTVDLGTGRPGKTVTRVTLSDLGITKMQASRWRLLASIPDDQFEDHIRRRLDGGRELTTSAMLKVAKRLKTQRERENLSLAGITADCGVHHGDFRELGAMVADSSVGLVFTDPPYDADAVALYGDLAAFAERVLIPGGWLVAYCGQSYLPCVLDAVRGSSALEWGHQFCCLHAAGGRCRIHKLNISAGWKAILAFYKPPLLVDWQMMADVVSGGREKEHHPWQQSLTEAEHFVNHFAPEGSLVCDPFAGSGTTLAAATRLERKAVGFEICEEHVATARARMAAGTEHRRESENIHSLALDSA